MRLSNRMRFIPSSGTISVMEKVQKMIKEGKNVFRLDIGDPGFDTPEHIKKVAHEAIQNGYTHYTSSKGILELREVVSNDLKTKGVVAEPNTEIIVTPGSKHSIFCACFATLNPGDEVLILSPSWPTHFVIVQATGAKPIEVPTKENFGLAEEALKEAITEKTKMILFNSPNNPTGGALEKSEVRVIADIAEDSDLLVLSDEIYDRLVYDGFKQISIASLDDVKERTITVNGFSKTYAMTGWRLGYAAADEKIIGAMARIQSNTTTCSPTFVQKAAIVALTGSQDTVYEMIEEYDKRRTLLVRKLNEIDGISCLNPKGAFYVFPDISKFGKSSDEIVDMFLEKVGLSSTAGSVFGNTGEGHIRLSYAMSGKKVISEAMEALNTFIEDNF